MNKPTPRAMCDQMEAFGRLVPMTTGDIVEFGVFDGGNTVHLASFGREVWALDTFSGLPVEEFDPQLDHDMPGKFVPTFDVKSFLSGFCNVTVLEGLFSETIQTLPKGGFGFVFIDCDYYRSYIQVLEWVEEIYCPGMILLADDYFVCKGSRKAVDEWSPRFAVEKRPLPKNLGLELWLG